MWSYTAQETTETVTGLSVTTADASQPFSAEPFHIAFLALVGIVSLFQLFTIFQYNNRSKQASWVQIGIIMLLLEIMALVLLTQRGPFLIGADATGGTVAVGFALPVVALMLLWFARRRIKADEELVKSVDRIR